MKRKTARKGRKALRVLLIALVVLGAAFALVVAGGGDSIRWFGKSSERIGEKIKDASDDVAVKADDLSVEVHEGAREIKDDVAKKITGKD